MLVVWLFALGAISHLYWLRKEYSETSNLEAQFRLYELRDDLRGAVMRGEVKASNWVFCYLDSTLSKAVRVVDRLDIWKVAESVVLLRNDSRLHEAQFHLQRELEKESNRTLKELHERYVHVLVVFLMERHRALGSILRNLARAAQIGKSLVERANQAVRLQAESPDLSTLVNFA